MEPNRRSLRRAARAGLLGLVTIGLACGHGGPTPPRQEPPHPEPPLPSDPELPPAGSTTLGGRVVTLDGSELPDEVWLHLRALDFSDSVRVAPDGSYSITVDHDLVGTPTGVLALPRGSESYHPAFWFFDAGLTAPEITLLLFPHEMEIPSGRFMGERLPLDVEAAFGQLCPDGSPACPIFWNTRPDELDTPAPHWLTGDFPVPVAFDRESSTHELTAEDSLALWGSIATLEAGLGRDLFRPARIEDFDRLDLIHLRREGVVTVRVAAGRSLSSTRIGFDTQTGRMEFATVAISRPDVFDESVTRHELIHTLGLNHTCGWRTLMLPSVCSEPSSSTLTGADVVHTLAHLHEAAARETLPGLVLGTRAALHGLRFARDSLAP